LALQDKGKIDLIIFLVAIVTNVIFFLSLIFFDVSYDVLSDVGSQYL